MFATVAICTILATTPESSEISATYKLDSQLYAYEASLTPEHRNRIWNQIHLAIHLMHRELSLAKYHANNIYDYDIRAATVGAIEGAIAGIGGKSVYSVVTGACLGAVCKIAGDSYYEFCESRDHTYNANMYAEIADELQERLWRDE